MGKYDLTETPAAPTEQTAQALGLRDNVFARSFRGGVYGAGSQLADLGGLVAENVGAPQTAASLRASALGLRESAALPQNSPRIGSFKSLREDPTLSNAGEYVGGLIGGSLPVMGAGIAGGLATGGAGVVPAMLGAAAATAPFEMGDVVQKQNADPQAMLATPGARLRDAAFAGGASALAQGIVPGAVAGKIAGRSVGGVMKSNLASIPIEGIAEGGGEAIKQFGANQGKPLDWEAIGENAIGGAAAGGAFGAVGAGADLARGAAPGVGKALQTGAGALKDRLTPSAEPEGVVEPPKAPDRFKAAWDDLQDLVSKGREKVDDSVARMKAGTPLGDLKEMATAQGDRLAQMTDFSASEGLKKASQWGDEMLNDAGLTPERRQAVTEAMSRVGDKAGQMAMAGLKEAQDRATTVMGKIKAFHEAYKRRDVEGEVSDVTGRIGNSPLLLKSEDLRGATEAVVRDIVPMLQQSNPDLVESAEGINLLAPALVSTVKEMQRGPLSADRIARLIDILGADTSRVLVKLDEMFGSKDPAKVEAFFQQVQDIGDVQKRTDDLDQLVRTSLTPEAQELTLSTMVPQIVEKLRNITRGISSEAGQKSARGTVMTSEFRRFMTDHFGAAADTVSKAFEKEAKLEAKDDGGAKTRLDEAGNMVEDSEGGFDEHGRRKEEAAVDVMTFGLTKPDKAGHSKSALNGIAMQEGSKYARQHLADLKAKYPDHDVRFEKLPGSDYGHIVVENRTNPGEFSAADLKAMAHDTNNYYESASRLKIGDHNIDAVRVAKVTGKKEAGKFEAETDVPAIQHTVDMFKRGIAQLSAQFNEAIDVPDDAVIGFSGKVPLTWGDAQRLARDTATDRMSEGGKKKLAALRSVYKGADPDAKADILAEVQDIMNYERDRELTADLDTRTTDAERYAAKLDTTRQRDVKGNRKPKHNYKQPNPNETKNAAYDDEGGLTTAGAQMLLQGDAHGGIDVAAPSKALHELDRKSHDSGQGRTAVGKDENIHLASAAIKDKDLVNRSNMDGSAQHVSGYVQKEFAAMVKELVGKVRKWGISAPAKVIAERTRTLIESVHSMSGADQRALVAMRDMTAGEAAPEVNRLARKYMGVVSESKKSEPKGGTPDPKAVAAKKAAFLERARSGDETLIEELQASTDAKGLQRAAEIAPPGPVLDAINTRLGELVQDPDVAYGLQTKKYSLVGLGIHNDLNKPGFPATHDSPIKHEGKFDWRKHSGKGEGNASFGAGTYLSTADGVHRSYKDQFTENIGQGTAEFKINGVGGEAYRDGEWVVEGMNRAEEAVVISMLDGMTFAQAKEAARTSGEKWFVASESALDANYLRPYRNLIKERKALPKSLEKVSEPDDGYESDLVDTETARAVRMWNNFVRNEVEKMRELDAIKSASVEIPKSPTYEVSVDIKPEELLDWDKPLSEQSEFVQQQLKKEGFENSAAAIDNGSADISGAKIYQVLAKHYAPKDEDGNILDAVLGQEIASDYLQSLGILGHKYAAGSGKNDTHPNFVIYDDAKIETNYVHFSAQSTNPNAQGPVNRKAVEAYLDKVLGASVKRAWANFTHAGEFDTVTNTIRLSVHALDPMSTAYHESLHAFFKQLKDTGGDDIASVLLKAAESRHVIDQMTAFFKNEPSVLTQLADREERAAYMYQMWAAGQLTVGPQVRTLFRRIADYIRKLLGVWSNDERALHIMEYFSMGEYAKNLGSPNAVRRALMEPGRNQAYETAKTFTEPMAHVADAIVSTGSGRMRDTDIPSLIRLADVIKREHIAEGGDQGFIAAARIEGTKRRAAMAETLKSFSKETLDAAMEGLHNGTHSLNSDVRDAQDRLKAILRRTKTYMEDAGVNLGDLGPDYFPRVWDTHYISKHQKEFTDMLAPYERAGHGDAKSMLRALMGHEGNEFQTETNIPGMQFKKTRLWNFITPQDASRFVNKDLMGTMSSYITQAARRAEWERRLGGGKLEAMFTGARREGATDADLKLATDYLKGVDGTLGDTLNPTARRLMGNMIVYQNVRLLPLAVFSSIVDPLGVMVRGGTVGDAWTTFKRGMAEIPANFGRKTRNDEAAKMAELVGVVDSAMLTHTLSDLYTQGMVGGTAQKINNAFFRFNLMEGLNRSFRVGATEAAAKFMQRHADGTASGHSTRWMNELGLQAGDVRTVNGRMALTVADGLTPGQVVRVHAAINQWVDGAVLRPDAADKPIWMNDPHYALISHLKQFVYSFQKTIIDRVVHEFEHGNYSPVMALASYVPVMIAADFIKGVIQGGGDQPEWKKGWDMADYVGYGAQRAGLLGVGQFGYDVMQNAERGGTGIGALVGPTLEQFGDVVTALNGKAQYGPVVLHALPANALYAGVVSSGDDVPDPVRKD